MRDKLLHIPNERLEGPESFLLVFLCTYKHGFLFLHIWFIVSTHLWFMTLLWCGRNKIGPNQENCVPSGSSSHSLVCDRPDSLVIEGSVKRRWELKHNTKWKSWIQFIWHLTWQCLQKWQFWIFILHCLMKRDGVNRMFPFAKWDINRGSRYEPKNN